MTTNETTEPVSFSLQELAEALSGIVGDGNDQATQQGLNELVLSLQTMDVINELEALSHRLQKRGIPLHVYINTLTETVFVGLSRCTLLDGTAPPDINTASEDELVAHSDRAFLERLPVAREALRVTHRAFLETERAKAKEPVIVSQEPEEPAEADIDETDWSAVFSAVQSE